MTIVHLTKRVHKKQTSGSVRRFYFFVLVFTFFTFLSISACATNTHKALADTIPLSAYIPEQFAWAPICNGADYAFFENKDIPLRYHCVKLNLTTPALTITAFPASESDFFKSKNSYTAYTKGQKTTTFAKKSKSTVAINTTPFAGRLGKKRIIGTHIVKNAELGEKSIRHCALVFLQSQDGLTAHIIDSQSEEALSNAIFACGGFWTILREGTTRTFANIHNSRMACGLSADGKTLYLLAVEGKPKRKSIGLSYMDCAEIFKALGATDAMEFDGGRSTVLAISGENVLSYSSKRHNACSLGFVFEIPEN